MDELRVPTTEELVMMSSRGLELVEQQFDLAHRRLLASRALMVQRVDAVSGFVEDGHRNITAWVRATNNWPHRDARDLVRLANAMKWMPGFQTACLEGLIGLPQMHAIAAVAANPRSRDHLEGADALFTDAAQRLSIDDLGIFLRHWEALADEDGARSRHDRAIRDRRARVAFVGARMHLDAHGPAHDGLTFEAVLAQFVDLEWQLEWDMLAAVHGDQMHAGLMERTPQQRSFDALQRIFSAAAGSREAGSEPTINILIDQATFERELHRIIGDEPEPVDPNVHAATRRCEDTDGHPLDPHAVTAMALVARVRRVVLGAGDVVINMGRRQRLFTGPAREAVLFAHRRCTRVGCNVPSSRCQADHLTPHGQHGLTDVDNGAPACSVHNRHRNHGYRTVRDPAGLYHTIRPDGTEVGWPVFRTNMHGLGLIRDELFSPEPDP
ncbi:MAG: DUF222 domain-containing protein [Ilumatobacteraceae bacterium]